MTNAPQSAAAPRRVTVLVSRDFFAQSLPYLHGLGRIVNCQLQQNFPNQWQVEIENPDWPPGPSGLANVIVSERREGIFFTTRAEIVLPGATSTPWRPDGERATSRLEPAIAAKAAKAIHTLINANVRSPTQAEIEQVLIGELGA